MKFVITGSPSSGKTTIVSILKKIGFFVVPETARDVIITRKNRGLDNNESSIDLQLDILKQQLKREDAIIAKSIPIFFDRGVPDALSYLKILETFPNVISRESLINRYDKVFFLESLPIEDDGVRETNPERVQMLNQALRDVYEELGYTLVNVPSFSGRDQPTSIALRLQLIFSHILDR